MLEWNVPLVSSLMTLKWEVLQTPWRDERPRRGIWIYWSTGQSATAGHSFNRGKLELLQLGWSNVRHKQRLGDEWLGAAQQKGTLGHQ